MKVTNFIFTIIFNLLLLIFTLGADGRAVSVSGITRQPVSAVQCSGSAQAAIPELSSRQQTELLLIALLCGICFLFLLTFSPLSEMAYHFIRHLQNQAEVFE